MQCLACNRCSGPFTVIMDYITIILNCQLKSKWNSVLSHWLKRKDDFQAGAMILLLCFLNLWTCGYFKVPEEDCRIYKKKDDKLETERTPTGQHLCFSDVLAPWVYCACLVTSNSLWPHELQPMGSPGKNTGVGCCFLLQGIFLTQGSNPHLLCLLHCRQILYRWATRKAQEVGGCI